MKLILCPECMSVFNLTMDKFKTCECGKCKGRYIDEWQAEVSECAISLAIGNGSLTRAIYEMEELKKSTNDKAKRNEYIKEAAMIAWVRPNTGKGNPHTKIIKENT